MADHTCNSKLETEYGEPVRVQPPKVIYQNWKEVSCDICGRLQSKVNMGTEEK